MGLTVILSNIGKTAKEPLLKAHCRCLSITSTQGANEGYSLLQET